MKYDGSLLTELWRLLAVDEPRAALSAMTEATGRALGLDLVAAVLIDPLADAARVAASHRRTAKGPALPEVIQEVGGRALDGYLRRQPVITLRPGRRAPAELVAFGLPGDRARGVVALCDAGGEPLGVMLAISKPGEPAVPERLLAEIGGPLAAALGRAIGASSAASAPPPEPPPAADRDGLSDRVIGADGGLRMVLERVAQVSRSDAPVLIFGETGSGKEVIARAIHAHSLRVDAPFIRVNCGAIPRELIDSELFGHERGAFTGAVAARRGWFEQAHKGTLLLDEIGELPLHAQVRLLRVLQDGTFQRVGGERGHKVDVRVIAATHRDLGAMVHDGTFREDLWYRLAVFPIYLPPLRDHKDDIPAMAEHFARRAAQRFGVAYRQPTARDLELLASYDWPGNVRELGAVIDRAVLIGEGKRLDVAKALGTGALLPARAMAEGTGVRAGAPTIGGEPVIEPLAVAMRQHIERALAATGGRIEGRGGAAALLEINPHTLRARMRKLGIAWSRFRGR